MPLDHEVVETVTFDSFGTLVDPRSARRVLDGVVPDPDALVEQWHPVAAQYATFVNYLDTYETYFDLHVDALRHLASGQGVDLPPADARDLTEAYHDLDPYDDVRESVERLADAGYDLAVLSNGDLPMLESLAETTGIADRLEALISADEIRTFKPDAALYDHAADRLGVPADAIAHASAGWGDVMGAVHAGMQGAWVDRGRHPWPPFGPEAHLGVEVLDDLAAALDA
jgi:2-haloacid dehalogenase